MRRPWTCCDWAPPRRRTRWLPRGNAGSGCPQAQSAVTQGIGNGEASARVITFRTSSPFVATTRPSGIAGHGHVGRAGDLGNRPQRRRSPRSRPPRPSTPPLRGWAGRRLCRAGVFGRSAAHGNGTPEGGSRPRSSRLLIEQFASCFVQVGGSGCASGSVSRVAGG